eukprot:gene1615-1177_t
MNTKKEQHQYPFIFGYCMCRFAWARLGLPRRASALVSPWRPRRGLSPIFNSKEARPNFFRSTSPKPRAAPPPTTSSNLTPHEREEDDGFFLDIDRLDDQIEDLTIAPSSAFRSGFVSIVGNANVGKSTLLNAILGQKLNIVSPKPQTTRHGINGILTEANCQMVLTDTPGMLAPKYTMHEAMRDAIHDAVRDTDVVLLVTDVYGEALQDDGLMQRLNNTNTPIIVAINKVDLLHHQTMPPSNASSSSRSHGDVRPIEQLQRLWAALLPQAEIVAISAIHRQNVDALVERLRSFMQPGPKYYPEDDVSDRDERFFTTEIIRETLFEMYQEEIPYSCEVVINRFHDKSPGLSVIEASIVVEKDSQQAIVIGKAGAKVKELGSVARTKLEEFLQRRVYLELSVTVDKDWRKNRQSLKKYGYLDD